MSRQSISLTERNDEWLRDQVENEEYSSKSEAINDLIRRAREKELEVIRARLILAENSGFTDKTSDEILAEIKKKAGI